MTPSDVPPMASYGEGYRFHVTGLSHNESGFPTNDPAQIEALIRRLDRKIARYEDLIVEVVEDAVAGATIGVFAYGSTARAAASAVRQARAAGIAVDFLAPLTLWPFPARPVAALGRRVRDIVVPEMNLGQMAHEVEWAVGREARVHSLTRVDGEPIRPGQILERILELGGRRGAATEEQP
jgi:2-oxoglutarate ferredoxin oxidoreductase subunit alpha